MSKSTSMEDQKKMKPLSTNMRKQLLSKRRTTTETTYDSWSESDISMEKNEREDTPISLDRTQMRSRHLEPTVQVSVSTLFRGFAPRDLPLSVDGTPCFEFLPQDRVDTIESTSRFLIQKDQSYSTLSTDTESIGSSTADIYGQVHPHETPELVAAKLVVFDHAVAAIPDHKKQGLNQAMAKCPELLDDKFKLKFLRCEVFNEKPAAKRYAKYWDRRIHIFGPVKAFLPLTQTEALKDDAYALSRGFLALTGTKDSSGRNIIFADPELQDIGAYTTESMARAIWYVFHAALEDEETQKKGVVFLSDLSSGKLSQFDSELVRIVALSVQGCIPVRLSGIHGCMPPRIFNCVFPIIKMFLGNLKKRVRIHGGSLERVQKELVKYGLTKAVIPTSLGGHVVMDQEAWLTERRKTLSA